MIMIRSIVIAVPWVHAIPFSECYWWYLKREDIICGWFFIEKKAKILEKTVRVVGTGGARLFL